MQMPKRKHKGCLRSPTMKETGRYAHIEMGEWDGDSFELDADYPIYELADGKCVVYLDGLTADELPAASDSEMRAVMDPRNGKGG